MKFTVPVQTIIEPISKVASICTKNPSNPDDLSQFVLFELKHDSLTLYGTDNTVQLKAVIPLAEGNCDGEGAFLLLAPRAGDFFKSLGKEDDISINFDPETEMLIMVSDVANYTVRARKAPEDASFPIFTFPDNTQPQTLVIEENKLHYMINKSIFCVSRENFRDYLKGVRFEAHNDELTIFALDGHRMAAVDTKLAQAVTPNLNFSMTLTGVNELQKLLNANKSENVTILATEEMMSTTLGIYTLSNNLLRCTYPNVRAVLPAKCNPEIAVPVNILKNNVKRVSLFSNKRLNAINMMFTHNRLVLHSQNSDHEVAKATLDINFPDPEIKMEVNLNADFMKDFLNAIDTPNVVFGFAPPYNNTLVCPSEEYNELGIRVRYVVSHIMV